MARSTPKLWLLEQRTRLSPGAIRHIFMLTQASWVNPVLSDGIENPGWEIAWMTTFAPSPDGSTYLAMGESLNIDLYDAATSTLIWSIGHYECQHNKYNLMWSPTGTRFAVVWDQRINVHDADDGKRISECIHTPPMSSLVWNNDDQLILTSPSGFCQKISIRDCSISPPGGPKYDRVYWSPDRSKYIASGYASGIVMTTDNRTIGTIPSMHTAAWSPDGTKIATEMISSDAGIAVWQPDGTKLAQSVCACVNLDVLLWSPDGSRLAAIDTNRAIHIWNSYCQLLVSLRSGSDLRHLTWAPDGSKLAACGVDDKVYIWTVRGDLCCQSTRHTDLRGLKWLPDGSKLATQSRHGIRFLTPT